MSKEHYLMDSDGCRSDDVPLMFCYADVAYCIEAGREHWRDAATPGELSYTICYEGPDHDGNSVLEPVVSFHVITHAIPNWQAEREP